MELLFYFIIDGASHRLNSTKGQLLLPLDTSLSNQIATISSLTSTTNQTPLLKLNQQPILQQQQYLKQQQQQQQQAGSSLRPNLSQTSLIVSTQSNISLNSNVSASSNLNQNLSLIQSNTGLHSYLLNSYCLFGVAAPVCEEVLYIGLEKIHMSRIRSGKETGGKTIITLGLANALWKESEKHKK